MTTRLETLLNLRARIQLEIEREQAFQRRMRLLDRDAVAAITTRGDWTMRVIVHVARHYDLTPTDLVGPDRRRLPTEARHVAAWILRYSGRTFPEIGQALGRDHSSIMAAVERIARDELLRAAASTIHADLVTSPEELTA